MIIGLCGKKRAGKSTVAKYLMDQYGFHEISWAYPLKEIIGRQLFRLNDGQLYGTEAEKEAEIPLWGMSARTILQKVGTECFRKQIDPDFWVKIGALAIQEHDPIENDIVVSDCRFPNEMLAIKELGGYTVRVVKTGQRSEDTHESETALDNYQTDVVIEAIPGDILGLQFEVDRFLTDIRNAIRTNR